MDLTNILKANLLLDMSRRGIDRSSIKGLVLMQLADALIHKAPGLFSFVEAWWNKKREQLALISAGESETREIRSSIVVEKFYEKPTAGNKDKQIEYNKVVESILATIANLDYVESLLFVEDRLLPNFKTPIPLTRDESVWFVLLGVNRQEGDVTHIAFKLLSYTHDVIHLKNFLQRTETEYKLAISNKLGDALYFFDHNVIKMSGRGPQRRDPRFQQVMPQLPFLTYNKHPFHTNRTFENIFFEDRQLVEERLQFFLNNRAWYDRKGIPYTLGFLFYGTPGCGKTSTIKAIANVTGRHIINVNLAEIKTKQQLKHMFYSDDLIAMKSGGVEVTRDNTDTFKIPINKRLYVIEDIDASSSVASRFSTAGAGAGPASDPMAVGQFEPMAFNDGASDYQPVEQVTADQEEIDLQTILNLLDGTLEVPERIIVVTTNCPEKLDNALIRPGRIDLFVEFKKANAEITRQMFEAFYDTPCPSLGEEEFLVLPDYRWTPAEINQILFRCFGRPEEAYRVLCEESPEELFKYSYLETGGPPSRPSGLVESPKIGLQDI